MPNGGTDNCSTCCYNEANHEQTGDCNAGSVQRCMIRELAIASPHYTYCANHPEHNHDLREIPVGPVTHGSNRKLLADSSDTPEIRIELLRILDRIPEIPRRDWPTTNYEDTAIEQLGKFRDPRARDGVQRACQFDPFASPLGELPDKSGRTRRNRIWTVAVAIEAFARIAGDAALPVIKHYLTPPSVSTNTPHGQWPTEIRFRSLLSLTDCSLEQAIELYDLAMQDVDPTIAKYASKLRDERLAQQ